MQPLSSPDPKNLIHDLSSSFFPGERRKAALLLGQLPMSNEEIVRALAIAQELDEDAEVRSAARQAFLSPANLAFIKDHPDFAQKEVDAAVQTRKQERQNQDERYQVEFLRRRSRERRYYLIAGCLMLAGCSFIWLGAVFSFLETWMVRVFQIGVFIFAGIWIWLSWRNWRCPACDSWFGGWTVGVNAIFSPATLKCPHCGTRLL